MKFAVLAVLVLTLVAGNACSSHVPPALQAKAAATYTLRDVNDALHAAYVLETSNSGIVPAANQKQILLAFAKAFDTVAVAATKLQTVTPGTNVPDTLNGVLASANDVLNAATQVVALPVKVVDAIRKAVAIAQAIVNANKIPGPSPAFAY